MCLLCSNKRRKLEVFNILSVPVDNVENTLASLQEEEVVDIECPKCKSAQAMSQIKIVKWLEILIIHFKWYKLVFDHNHVAAEVECNDRHVVLTENLKARHTIYELRSIIMHSGSYSSRHYTNLSKHENNWFYISDQSVKIANSITEELSKAGSLAYLMFFNKAMQPQ